MSQSKKERKRKARNNRLVVEPIKPASSQRLILPIVFGILAVIALGIVFSADSLADALLGAHYVPVSQATTTPVESGVDGSVRKVGKTYTSFGELETITCFDGNGGVVNQVFFEYDANRKLHRMYQSFDGTVLPNATPCLEYGYDQSRGKRLASVKYPGGRKLVYSYGVAGSIPDIMSFVAGIQDGETSLITYGHSGNGSIEQAALSQPGLNFNLVRDRFGRPMEHVWKQGDVDVVKIGHGYDKAGNRTFRRDGVHPAVSEAYRYDQTNQLKSLTRGPLNADGTAVTATTFDESWQYDKTGNWAEYNRNGNIENRTHNAANEIQGVASHDRNGNMKATLKAGEQFRFQYDAWNRVTKVFASNGSTKIAEYEYNGLNYRIRKKTFTNGVLASTRTYFYNEKWQCVEERVNNVVDTTYVWGLRYIDDLVCRDRAGERLYSLADPNQDARLSYDHDFYTHRSHEKQFACLTKSGSTDLEALAKGAFSKSIGLS